MRFGSVVLESLAGRLVAWLDVRGAVSGAIGPGPLETRSSLPQGGWSNCTKTCGKGTAPTTLHRELVRHCLPRARAAGGGAPQTFAFCVSVGRLRRRLPGQRGANGLLQRPAPRPTRGPCALPRPCPEDCVWDDWMDWSNCTALCRQSGSKTRTRRRLGPFYGGEAGVKPRPRPNDFGGLPRRRQRFEGLCGQRLRLRMGGLA